MKIDSTRKAVLYLTAVFAIGLVSGAVGGFAVGLAWKSRTPPAHEIEAKLYKDIKKKLNLRAEQESEVKAALHDVVSEIGSALKSVSTTASNAVVKFQQRIEPAMDATQRTALSNIVAESHSTSKK